MLGGGGGREPPSVRGAEAVRECGALRVTCWDGPSLTRRRPPTLPAGRGRAWAGPGRAEGPLAHFWKASRLLRKGKKEGSQTSPRSRQASVQALPAAASQARREWAGGQAPGARLAFRAHSRWVALGARTKGLFGAPAPGGAGAGAAQKSCGERAV